MWTERQRWLMPRYPRAGMLGGVCEGIAARFDWNARLIRVLAVLGLVFGGFFPVALVYLVLWYLMEPAAGLPGAASAAEGPDGRPPGAPLGERYARIEQRLRRLEACVSSREFELRREIGKLG